MWMLRLCVFAVAFGVVAGACFKPALEQVDVDGDTQGADDVDTTTADTGGAEVPDEVKPEDVGEVDGAEVVPTGPLAPTGLMATTDRSNDVRLTWFGAGPGFRVYRCEGDPCGGVWVELTGAPVAETSFIDTSAAAAGVPSAPTLTASTTLPMVVRTSWEAVVAPEPQVYSYRVTAAEAEVESAPSEVAVGSRSGRPVVGYEMQVDGGAWETIGAVTSWDDEAAGAPSVVIGGVAASQGVFAGHVELTASGVVANAGTSRTYRVRAATEYGPGAVSDDVIGRRGAGALTLQWQRSVGADEEAFEALSGANGWVVTDTGAPADGSVRYYRVEVGADGAESVTSESVAGWRQPPPGVPGGVAASSNLADQVRVSWHAVSGAIGYHVYRGETKLTTGTGIVGTAYEDFDTSPPGAWESPSLLTASTQRTDGIEISWVSPVRPVGQTASYSVSAVNATGEGALSASATGRRAAPAIAEWEVEAQDEVARTLSVVSSEQAWLDEDAPFARIEPGTTSATQGDRRNSVMLSHTGHQLIPAPVATYRVRGKLVGGGATPWSAVAEGRRANGGVTYRWQRSVGTVAQNFADLSLSAQSVSDVSAPSTGDRRWYRVELSAAGASTTLAPPVAGWRLAFASIAAGHNFTCALTPMDPDGGRVWCWGANDSGQLGRGHTNFASAIARVSDLQDVRALATGPDASHICARKGDASVWCWGSNQVGQLGDGTAGGNRPSPTQVLDLSSQGIAVGGATSCSRHLGRVHCWGDNYYGQVGANLPGATHPTPAAVHTSTGTLTLVARIAVGGLHGCATTSSDELWCWGYNDSFQLSATEPTDSGVALFVRDIVVSGLYAGGYFNCGRSTSGSLHCWGSNGSGALGQPIQVVRSAEPLEIPNLVAIEASLGGGHGCAVTSEAGANSIRCWGYNNRGQLGNGSTTSNHIPQLVLIGSGSASLSGAMAISAGSEHSCAIADHVPYCWGGTPASSTRAVAVTLP